MKPLPYIFLIAICMFSCSKESIEKGPIEFCNTSEGEKDKINVRIYNLSSYDISNFNYDNKHTFDHIGSGDTTCYIQLDNSWDIPSYQQYTINGKEKGGHLIDPLGLKQLTPDDYTYILYASNVGVGAIISGGRIYNNEIIRDFNLEKENCIELIQPDCNPQPNKINIRIKNSTAVDFCNLELEIVEDKHQMLGKLKSGESTCYLSFDEAKIYPFSCNFMLGNNEYIIENPSYHNNLDVLPPGNYTYNVHIIGPDTKFANITMSND